MIFKCIGGIMIIAASSFLGFCKAKEYKVRVQQLSALQTAIAQFETEIRFTQTPLAEAFFAVAAAADDGIGALFEAAGQTLALQTGQTAGTAWNTAVDSARSGLSLSKEDLEIIRSFGSALGASDTEGQMKHIAATQEKLAVQLEQARQACGKNQKLFQSLGVYAGILIAILLF